MKKILLCGCDNAGKTTIAEELAKKLNCPVRGKIVRVADPRERAMAHLRDLYDESTQIMDRSYFISDMVYEPIVSASGECSPFSCDRKMWEDITQHKAIVIFVDISEQTCKARFELEGDDIQTLEIIQQARVGYENFFKTTSMKYIKVENNGEKSPEQIADFIISYLYGTGEM